MFNTKVRLLLIMFMLFSPLLAYPAPAWGCSCEEPPPPQEAFVRASAVFVGRVTGNGGASVNPLYTGFVQVYQQLVPPLPPIMEPAINDRTIWFDVEDSWRGVKTTQMTLRTGWDDGDCGYDFQPDKQYIVYAYESSDGSLYSDICSRTAPVASAAEDLKHLQTERKLELTYVPPMFNPLMLCLIIPLLGTIVLAVVIWRRRYTRKRARE